MTEKEKKLGKKFVEAVNLLPEPERQYLLGYAEGVKAMERERQKGREEKAG